MKFTIENTVLKNVYSNKNDPETIIIPDGITEIAESAFRYNGYVKHIVIPDSVTEIGAAAFSECYRLKYINLPPKLKIIRELTFDGCALAHLHLPKHLEKIEEFAFPESSLCNIYIPQSVTMIEEGAFSHSQLKNIYISEKNLYYKSLHGVLYDKTLETLICCPPQKKSIKIPETVRCISPDAFCGCFELTEIELPASISCIENGTFIGCSSLKKIKIPDSIESIGRSAFFCCSSLESICIPDNVKSIGTSALAGCGKLKYIRIPANIKIEFPKDPEDEIFLNESRNSEHPLADFVFSMDSISEIFLERKRSYQIDIYFPEGTFRIHNIGYYENALAVIQEKNYDIDMNTEEKYFLLWQIYVSGLHDGMIESYIQQHFDEMSPVLIKYNYISALKKILQKENWIHAENIDSLILDTNQNQKIEMQIMLMNYRNENLECQKNWEL